jgi:hypothetical protein
MHGNYEIHGTINAIKRQVTERDEDFVLLRYDREIVCY